MIIWSFVISVVFVCLSYIVSMHLFILGPAGFSAGPPAAWSPVLMATWLRDTKPATLKLFRL